MRAREPDLSGYAIANDGVRLSYEVHGTGPQTVFLLPTWPALDARVWKLQVPYLARHYRVLVADPRGNGRSDRPVGPDAYADSRLVQDAVTVLDASGTVLGRLRRAVAGRQPVAPAGRRSPGASRPQRCSWLRPCGWRTTNLPAGQLDSSHRTRGPNGWGRYNAAYWRDDLAGFARWFFGEVFCEPHSTKQVDDAVEWTLQAGVETLIDIERAPYMDWGTAAGGSSATRLAQQVRCPSLVITGDDDRIVEPTISRAIAEALGCPLEVVAGGGHCVQARHPVWFNLRLRRFVDQLPRFAAVPAGVTATDARA